MLLIFVFTHFRIFILFKCYKNSVKTYNSFISPYFCIFLFFPGYFTIYFFRFFVFYLWTNNALFSVFPIPFYVLCFTKIQNYGESVHTELPLWSRGRVDGSHSEGPRFDSRVRRKFYHILDGCCRTTS